LRIRNFALVAEFHNVAHDKLPIQELHRKVIGDSPGSIQYFECIVAQLSCVNAELTDFHLGSPSLAEQRLFPNSPLGTVPNEDARRGNPCLQYLKVKALLASSMPSNARADDRKVSSFAIY